MKTSLFLLALAACGPIRAEGPKFETALVGHRAAINAVTFAPRGAMLASASEDGTVKLWTVAGGRNSATFAHPSPVISVAFDDSGSRLVTGCRDGTVKVWNLIIGRNTFTVRAEHPARSVWFCNTYWERWAGEDKVGVTYPAKNKPSNGTDFWDLTTGKQVPLVVTCSIVNKEDVSAYHDNDEAIANEDPVHPSVSIAVGEIWMALERDGRYLQPTILRGHTGRVNCLAFTPRGDRLISAGQDGTIRFWNPAGREPLAAARAHAGPASCLAISRDGETLASGGSDATIRLWKLPKEEGR